MHSQECLHTIVEKLFVDIQTFVFHTEAPRFVRAMRKEVTVEVGDSSVLECFASGAPKPVISWYKDNTRVQSSDHVVFAESGQMLVIPQSDEEDAGSYACEATNSQGTVTHRVKLSVETGRWIVCQLVRPRTVANLAPINSQPTRRSTVISIQSRLVTDTN